VGVAVASLDNELDNEQAMLAAIKITISVRIGK
jgi:hypothetical protein